MSGFVSIYFFFFKQKTAYEMRISDWSSDVCSSDLVATAAAAASPPWPGSHDADPVPGPARGLVLFAGPGRARTARCPRACTLRRSGDDRARAQSAGPAVRGGGRIAQGARGRAEIGRANV